MALGSDKSIILLPIKPRFAELIIRGKKKVEFRRRGFRNKISHVVLYATNPIKKILGYFEVSHIDEDSPKKLWDRYKKVGGITYEEFKNYYSSSDIGIAIGVGEVYVLQTPVPLSMLTKSLTSPQGFVYITPNDFDKIQDRVEVANKGMIAKYILKQPLNFE